MRQIISCGLILILCCQDFCLLAKDDAFVHHPEPKNPIYVDPDWYRELKQQLAPLPQKGSAAEKADIDKLVKYQKTRTALNCTRANDAVLVSLQSFYGSPYGPLDKSVTQKLAPFFEQLRNDGDYFIQLLKKDFPRPRPFAYVPNLSPCVPREITGAYPSGHAVLSRLYELVLGDLFPTRKQEFAARAKRIGEDRVLSGMHHPSDVAAGQKLGALVYAEFKKSKKFKEDFNEQKRLLK